VYHLTGSIPSRKSYGYRHASPCILQRLSEHLQIRRNTAVSDEALYLPYGYHSDKAPRRWYVPDSAALLPSDNHPCQKNPN